MNSRVKAGLSVAIVVGVMAVGIGILLGGFWLLGRAGCYMQWGDAYETKFDLGGCKLKVDGKWLPEKAFAVRETGR